MTAQQPTEYLRRNLEVCKAAGIHANSKAASVQHGAESIDVPEWARLVIALAASAPALQAGPRDREALIDLIGQHLTAMYCCTRVWSAWGVGTMGEDDFIPAEQTDFAADLADAILASPTHERAAPAPEPVLPYDVTVGGGTFRKGVKLSTFVLAAQGWHRAANPKFYTLTGEEKAENLRRLQGCANPSAPEPVYWEYRWLDTANTPHTWSEWQRCEPRNPYTDTAADKVREIQGYIDDGYKYELRALYASPSQPVAAEGVREPTGWLKPNESYAPDAFRWKRTNEHTRPLFAEKGDAS